MLNTFKKILSFFTFKNKKQQHNNAQQQTLHTQILNPQINLKTNTMSIYNYGIGGNEVKVDANEAIQEIQNNKTLLISQLTADDPTQPEAIYGLKTPEDVFKYFRPNIDAEMETADGQTVKENMKFQNLGDFTPKNLTQQSPFLSNLSIQQEQYVKIMKQLKSNKVLRSMLENEETKGAVLQALKNLAQELETAK